MTASGLKNFQCFVRALDVGLDRFGTVAWLEPIKDRGEDARP